MAKALGTYKELLEEKEKLQKLLDAKKQLVNADIEELKLQLKPLSEIRMHITTFTARNAANLILALNSDAIAKYIFKKIAVARGGQLAKWLVPYFLKKYSPTFIGQQKDKIINWARHWFKQQKKGFEHQTNHNP